MYKADANNFIALTESMKKNYNRLRGKKMKLKIPKK